MLNKYGVGLAGDGNLRNCVQAQPGGGFVREWTDIYPPPAIDEAVIEVTVRLPTSGALARQKELMSVVTAPPLYIQPGQELRIRIIDGRVHYAVSLETAPAQPVGWHEPEVTPTEQT